jgi:hypothetical protein
MPRWPEFRLPPTPCPYCDKPLDAASSVNGGAVGPTPGDYTVCLYCAQPLIYLADLHLGKPPPGAFEAACRADRKFGAKMRATMRVIRRFDRKRL